MAKRKIYLKRGWHYADFREFYPEGGRCESLRTKDRPTADLAYDRRYSELLNARIARTPPSAYADGGQGVLTLEILLRQFAQAQAPYVDTRVTRDRDHYRELITQGISGYTEVVEIDRATVEDFVGFLKDDLRKPDGSPYAESFQDKILQFLRRALGWATRRGYIVSNPASDLDPITLPGVEPEKETQFYTVPEAGAILSALQRNPDGSTPKDWPWRTPDYLFEQVAFGLLTGARRNEVMAQRWEWTDLNSSVVHVMTSKRRRGRMRDRPEHLLMRHIRLWPQLREILLPYWQRMGEPTQGLLFPKLRVSERRQHVTRVERGGVAYKSIKAILRLRKVISGAGTKGSPLLFLGRPGYQIGWREFRVTYCAVRLQTVEPVAGHENAWVPVAQRTVELEMGHASADMIQKVYGRVTAGEQLRLTAVAYPLTRPRLPPPLPPGGVAANAADDPTLPPAWKYEDAGAQTTKPATESVAGTSVGLMEASDSN